MSTAIPMADPADWRNLLRHGMIGADIAAWQVVLLDRGYDLTDAAGFFGDSTHNATVSEQHRFGLGVDGIVGPATAGTIGLHPPTPSSSSPEFPTKIPFREARHWSRHVGPRELVKWVVIHSMEAPESSTRAEVCAGNMAHEQARKASAHYCIDCDSIVQCVREDRVAWHAPGANKYGIGLEHAGYARQSKSQWMDQFSTDMLELSAMLTARICHRWNIPVVALGFEELRAGEHGITTHAAVSAAFEKSTHWDPGPSFPMRYYLDRVLEHIGGL